MFESVYCVRIHLFADEVNFTKIATELYNSSGSTNTLLRQLLQISEDGNNTEDDNETGPKLSNGVIAAIAISTLTAVLGFVAVTVLVFTLLKRYAVKILWSFQPLQWLHLVRFFCNYYGYTTVIISTIIGGKEFWEHYNHSCCEGCSN